jgi:hypothetical protein
MPTFKKSPEILSTNGADSRQQNQNNRDAIYRARLLWQSNVKNTFLDYLDEKRPR